MKIQIRVISICLIILTTIFTYSLPALAESIGIERLSGFDRYQTAQEIARAGWLKSDYAILAYGENYPDALAAAPLAKKYNAPILLTDKDEIHNETKLVLEELNVTKVFIIGGYGVISTQVENQLKNMNINTTRLSGMDMYATAIEIAAQLGNFDEIAVTTGDNYSDALSIASVAAQRQMPIILVPKDYLPDSVQSYLKTKHINTSYVVGGEEIIDEDVVSKLSNPERIIGFDKYSRNIAVLTRFKANYDLSNVCLATGNGFADALSGAALAAKIVSPIVLVDNIITSVTKDYIATNFNNSKKVIILGGEAVVPSQLVNQYLKSVPDSRPYYQDNINLAFSNDPEVLGEWQAVDFIAPGTEFKPGLWQTNNPFLQKLTFNPDGDILFTSTSDEWHLKWTKGVIMNSGDITASHYTFQTIEGIKYMFYEWKSGDYIRTGKIPGYYVLKNFR